MIVACVNGELCGITWITHKNEQKETSLTCMSIVVLRLKTNNDTIQVEVWHLCTKHNGLGHVCNYEWCFF